MNAIGWKRRAGIVLSAIWLCLVFLVADHYERFTQTLAVGVLPLILCWGVVWAFVGWRRESRPGGEPLAPTGRGERLVKTLKLVATVVAIVFVGLYVAGLQFDSIGDHGPTPVATWFGEWTVYGLLMWGVLRAALPAHRQTWASVVAALFIVIGVNWYAYGEVSQARAAIESLVRATPLMEKIQSGTVVSDEEVRVAKIGLLEPVVLAQAKYSREILEANRIIEKAASDLAEANILHPETLATEDGRRTARLKIEMFDKAALTYQAQLELIDSRRRMQVAAAVSSVPKQHAARVQSGMDEGTQQFKRHSQVQLRAIKVSKDSVVGILDLLDANADKFSLYKGPPPNLRFSDLGVLGQYRSHVANLTAASNDEEESRAAFVKAQAEAARKVEKALSRSR